MCRVEERLFIQRFFYVLKKMYEFVIPLPPVHVGVNDFYDVRCFK